MEEDIKIIEEKLKIIESLCTDDCMNKSTVIKPLKYALENLLTRYKQQKERIRCLELKIVNQKDQIKLLRNHRLKKYVMSEYIEKSKVKEKIEEINNENLNYSESEYYLESEIKGYAMEHLQELLREE